MFKQLICVLLTIVAAQAAGDLIILSHPKSISYKGHEHIEESTLKEMYSAALGFTVEQSSSWSGMYLIDPFHLAEAVVNVAVDGISDIGSDLGHHFPLHTNEAEEDTWNALEKRIVDRYPDGNSNLIRVSLNEGTEAIADYKMLNQVKTNSEIKPKFLKATTEEDQNFLNELNLLNNIISQIEAGVVKKDNTRDVYWFVLNGLHAVSDLHGDNSSETIEAKQLLVQSLSKLNDAFKKAYSGNVLVTVITSDVSHTRFARSLKQSAPEDDNKGDLNLAQTYDSDYPVIFNIMLWFGVAMFFSLLAICYTIGGMDPGRDSIIYRMTSNRIKKDN